VARFAAYPFFEIRLNFVLNFLSRINLSEKFAKTVSSKGGVSAPCQRLESITAVRFRPEIILPPQFAPVGADVRRL
jgi:hypothetical protein